jgi:hypothetical protein
MNIGIDEIKVPSVFYRAIISGRLSFLLVPNGHQYQLHDVLRLAEIKSEGTMSGQICYVQVMFIISDPTYGVREGYAVLSIKIKIQSTRIRTESKKNKKVD